MQYERLPLRWTRGQGGTGSAQRLGPPRQSWLRMRTPLSPHHNARQCRGPLGFSPRRSWSDMKEPQSALLADFGGSGWETP